MIKLGADFYDVVKEISNFIPYEDLSFSSLEHDSQWYIQKYAIPTKYKEIGIIWLTDDVLLIFEDLRYIGYCVNLDFIPLDCPIGSYTVEPAETNISELRNKLSLFFDLANIMANYEKMDYIEIEQLWPSILEDAKTCMSNKDAILELLDRLDGGI